MNSSFEKIEEEAQDQIYPRPVHKVDQNEGDTSSDMLVLEARSVEDITPAFGWLGNGHDIKLSQNGEVNLDQENIKSGLHVIEGKTTNDDANLIVASKVTGDDGYLKRRCSRGTISGYFWRSYVRI